MTSLTSSALLVGAIGATNLPVLLLAVPAGVLGDLLDRKRLILAGHRPERERPDPVAPWNAIL